MISSCACHPSSGRRLARAHVWLTRHPRCSPQLSPLARSAGRSSRRREASDAGRRLRHSAVALQIVNRPVRARQSLDRLTSRRHVWLGSEETVRRAMWFSAGPTDSYQPAGSGLAYCLFHDFILVHDSESDPAHGCFHHNARRCRVTHLLTCTILSVSLRCTNASAKKSRPLIRHCGTTGKRIARRPARRVRRPYCRTCSSRWRRT